MHKRAFLCGINRYQIPGADLRGCVNDVENMRSVLTDLYGFSTDDISVITDSDATKANIESGLTDLVEGSGAGDVLYFHFSGHGSNVPDQDGDEADHRDEIFCPTDLDWADPLRDDWMRETLDAVPEGVNFTIVADCCHSGSITRAIVPPDAERIQRYLPCPRDLWAQESHRDLSGGVRSLRRSRMLDAGVETVVDVHDVDINELMITGCRADQTSADAHLGGDYNGALTHSIAAAIRDRGGQLTYRQLHQAVLERLDRDGFDQIPQLEGRATKFDSQFLAPLV